MSKDELHVTKDQVKVSDKTGSTSQKTATESISEEHHSNPEKVGSEMFAGTFAVGGGGGPNVMEDIALLTHFPKTIDYLKKQYPLDKTKP